MRSTYRGATAIFGLVAIVQEVIGHTEDHRAMLADEVAEITPALYRGLESDHLASVT